VSVVECQKFVLQEKIMTAYKKSMLNIKITLATAQNLVICIDGNTRTNQRKKRQQYVKLRQHSPTGASRERRSAERN
jgi:hypothetical protein